MGTGETYQLAAGDVGYALTVEVISSNETGVLTAQTPAVTNRSSSGGSSSGGSGGGGGGSTPTNTAAQGTTTTDAKKGTFYIDINTGMKTGWVQIDGKWYYFNPDSDGTRGIMFVNRESLDGYYLKEDGSWDEEERR